jgi:CubicO group peptidase (beta-lactamase class C family)
MRIQSISLFMAGVMLLHAGSARADKIDDVIRAEMARRQIPGLSLAIVDGGKIVKAKAYGVTEKGGKKAMTTDTLLQAGSVSKPVSALAALHLVEAGKLDLDEDVNGKLTSWKVPPSEYARDTKISLRRILSHSAGFNVHGFGGYAMGAPVPTLVQVLNGSAPANSEAIRLDMYPGTDVRYSGGGYTVMQQLLIDVSAKNFPDLLQATVLTPLGMTHSSYTQPLPASRAAQAASGHDGTRRVVAGRWHTYPEMAAAGLWTTPSDLTRFILGLQASLADQADAPKVLSASMARQMVTRQVGPAGLGLFINNGEFGHDRRNEGFDTNLSGTLGSGQGVAIMINSNDNSGMMRRIIEAVASQYKWPGHGQKATAMEKDPRKALRIDDKVLDRYTGYYEMGDGSILPLVRKNGRLQSQTDGFPDEDFAALSELHFASTASPAEILFEADTRNQAYALIMNKNGSNRKLDRISPLLANLKPQTEPQPPLREKVQATLLALAQGPAASAATGAATAATSSALAPNAKADFAGATLPEFAGLKALTFLQESKAAITRHNTQVDRIVAYKMDFADPAPRANLFVLVYVTAQGLIADIDAVAD